MKEMKEEKRLQKIQKRIDKIKQELAALGDMRPGSLTRQYKDPIRKRGPSYQLSYTLDMKSRTDYVRSEHVVTVRREIATYKRYKALTSEWISLSIERSRLKTRLPTL
jgi:hypothetical protein